VSAPLLGGSDGLVQLLLLLSLLLLLAHAELPLARIQRQERHVASLRLRC
jgi:hypothetical protein